MGKQEVHRQSVLFEVFKAEREYVADLEAVLEVYSISVLSGLCLSFIIKVFIEPLRNAKPAIIHPEHLQGFLSEVFGNLSEILAHHQSMLGALFARQREQHPLVQSVADIILDSAYLSTSYCAFLPPPT